MHSSKQYQLTELVQGLDVTIKGNMNCIVTGVATIQQAKAGHITFLTNPLYKKYLMTTTASAVILSEDLLANCAAKTTVVTSNPHYVYAKIAKFFETVSLPETGIHTTAVVHPTAQIHAEASIGANVVIGAYAMIAARATIGAGCVIGDDVRIDEACHLDANVTIYHHVNIGKRAKIASGVVIGSEGFGFANQDGTWHKVPQLGGVRIGDDVDIGANTTIDRGAIDDTVIENGVKLDNQIQIGHNTHIGAHTIIAGCCAIAGTTIIGKHCMIGGSSNFAGHLSVADHVVITGASNITKSIAEAGIYSSGIVGVVPNLEFRKNNARFYRLESLFERVKALEDALVKTERENT